MIEMSGLACVLVNFNSGELCVSAVRSLLDQEFEGADGLQIIVLDNCSPQDQRPLLEPLRDLGVELVYHDENCGYGAGINLGVERVEAEHVLFANPDILALPGSIDRMLQTLRDEPDAGLVGPRGFLDSGRFIMLPPCDLPTLSLHAWEALGRVHQGVCRRASFERSRRYFRAWRADAPVDMPMVSGWAMLMETEFARELGPFDARYPFYYEDADLCARVRAAGRRVILEPRAEMIHFFDQSARSVRAEVEEKYRFSRGFYFKKHFGAAGHRVFQALNGYTSRREHQEGWRIAEIEHLGELSDPFELRIDGAADGFLIEIATDPFFLFCGGHVFEGDTLRLGDSAWNALSAVRWYIRVLDPETLALLKFLSFDKTRDPLAPVTYEQWLNTP